MELACNWFRAKSDSKYTNMQKHQPAPPLQANFNAKRHNHGIGPVIADDKYLTVRTLDTLK